eukprot:gnl/TRDRNA2_/TRDRNA2_197467_c0_seq1.p1 gnl/TRDRNA2_/TRDRNA2_197467_c0~~gnl/TRDRNA2_/TRDRNA2_197467_c0_seq1.p1  ORF type:complete len:187 (+),score=26.26 gnl/TRDRNA2_/TRDRNA2_197467_c0_seq1:95-655(+)
MGVIDWSSLQSGAIEHTSFTPFKNKCGPASSLEFLAITHAQHKAKEAVKLAEASGCNQAVASAEVALKRLRPVTGVPTYLVFRLLFGLNYEVHKARMELEQAAQSAHAYCPGSKAGDIFACAADDLWRYDMWPNIHPMDTRLGCAPMPLPLLFPLDSGSRDDRGRLSCTRSARTLDERHSVAAGFL